MCSIDRMVLVYDEVDLSCSFEPSITTHVPNFGLQTATIPTGFSVVRQTQDDHDDAFVYTKDFPIAIERLDLEHIKMIPHLSTVFNNGDDYLSAELIAIKNNRILRKIPERQVV